MTVKELAAKGEALELEVARLRGELAAKSQPIVIQQPYPIPYQPSYPYVSPLPTITCDVGIDTTVRYIGSAS